MKNNNETIKIINTKQASLYMKNGVQPIRVYVGFKDKMVYEFDREKTKEVFTKWCNYELK